MNYNQKVLDLFKRGADRNQKIIKANGKRNLIILDLEKKDKEVKPNIQVVVPAEAATMRAESQLEEDIRKEENQRNYQSGTDHRSVNNKRRKNIEVEVVKDAFVKKRVRR